MRPHRGFTLIEMIMAVVITGIVAGMVSVFIARPVEGYIASERRAGMTDVADLAMKRASLDIRLAVPNSLRLSSSTASTTACTATSSSNCYLEYIPARTGGRYCADIDICPSGTTGALDFTAASDYFDVLGPSHTVVDTDFIVVNNTGQSGLNAYAGDNIRSISSHTAAGITFSGTRMPYPSPSSRFQAVPSTGPVTFACESIDTSSNTGTGLLRRYTSYATALPFGSTQPTSGLGSGALLADNLSACAVTYDAVSATNGLVTISITITRESESVTLYQQIHVDNMP